MKKILGISLILIGIFSGGMGIAVMGGGLAIPGFLVIAFGIYLLFSSSANKNKKISSIILGIGLHLVILPHIAGVVQKVHFSGQPLEHIMLSTLFDLDFDEWNEPISK